MINMRSHRQFLFQSSFRPHRSRGWWDQEVILSLILGAALSLFLQAASRCAAADANSVPQPSHARLEANRDEIANVRSNVFLTLVVLDKVRGEREPGGAHYQAFTNQLVRMEELAQALSKRAQEMKQRGDAYFADWEARTASIQNPDEKRKAEARFSERKASYDEIKRLMQEAKDNFMPFVDELTNIKKLLEGSRDQQSIAKAKSLFARANWHSLDVQRSLMQMEDEFEKLAATFGTDKPSQ